MGQCLFLVRTPEQFSFSLIHWGNLFLFVVSCYWFLSTEANRCCLLLLIVIHWGHFWNRLLLIFLLIFIHNFFLELVVLLRIPHVRIAHHVCNPEVGKREVHWLWWWWSRWWSRWWWSMMMVKMMMTNWWWWWRFQSSRRMEGVESSWRHSRNHCLWQTFVFLYFFIHWHHHHNYHWNISILIIIIIIATITTTIIIFITILTFLRELKEVKKQMLCFT